MENAGEMLARFTCEHRTSIRDNGLRTTRRRVAMAWQAMRVPPLGRMEMRHASTLQHSILPAPCSSLFAFVIGMFLAFLARRAGTHVVAVTGGASPNSPHDRDVRGHYPNTTG